MTFKTAPALTALALAAFCGCGDCGHVHDEKHAHAHHEKHAHAQEHEHGPGCSHGASVSRTTDLKSLFIPLSVQKTAGLGTVRAEMRPVVSTVSFPGRFELNPDARRIVSSPVSGRLELLVRPLADVKKGDALFTVSSPDLVSRAREIAVLEKRLSVYRGIKTANAALENELAVKRAEREAVLAGAEEKDGTVTVRAVEDGMIEDLPSENGKWLETGAAVVRTVRKRDLRFKALVAASEAAALEDGMPARVGGDAGRIRVGVGDDSGLVPVYVIFGKEPSAKSGERARAECVTDGTEKPRLALPSGCIVRMGMQPTVFMKDPDDPGRFIVLPVVPGASGGGWTAVETSHLPPGVSPLNAEFVKEGVYELKLAALSGGGSKPAGHFHADGTFHEGEH